MGDNKVVGLILQIMSIISAILVLCSAIFLFVWWGGRSFTGWVVGIFMILFGLHLLVADIKCFPQFGYTAFIYHPVGRGIWLIFLGAFCLGWHTFQIVAGAFVLTTALLWIVLGECVLKGCPRPLTQKNESFSLTHQERWA